MEQRKSESKSERSSEKHRPNPLKLITKRASKPELNSQQMVRFICLDHCTHRQRNCSRPSSTSLDQLFNWRAPAMRTPLHWQQQQKQQRATEEEKREREWGFGLGQNGRVLNHLETDYRHITCLTGDNLKLWQISLPAADWRSTVGSQWMLVLVDWKDERERREEGWPETRPVSDGMQTVTAHTAANLTAGYSNQLLPTGHDTHLHSVCYGPQCYK